MYYPFFITYLVAGFAFGIVLLFWAIKNGQFKDQQRARYLPLDEEEPQPVGTVSKNARVQSFILLGLMAFGLMAIVWVVIYAYLI
jgi:cbb3-type cytochrome oxidase maturation protein